MSTGEEKIWEALAGLDPKEVCRRTDVTFDPSSGHYLLKSFGRDFSVSSLEKKIANQAADGEVFLKRLGYFFRLSVMGYLAVAKNVALTGRLLNPVNMKSGQLFFRGSHVLPLEKIAEKYGRDREGFLKRGDELRGERLGHGDASMKLSPLPRVPVVLILWMEDDEFPARADLLFDSSCEVQMPIDVIWSVAMLSSLAML